MEYVAGISSLSTEKSFQPKDMKDIIKDGDVRESLKKAIPKNFINITMPKKYLEEAIREWVLKKLGSIKAPGMVNM